MLENIPRMLPSHLGASIDATKFNIPPIFAWIKRVSNVSDDEMLRTFNCGIGFVMIVANENVRTVLKHLNGENASVIGSVVNRASKQVTVDYFCTSIERVQKTLLIRKKRVAVLISGNGTNLQSLIEASRDTNMGLGADIVLVISNKPGAYGLQRAKTFDIATRVVEHANYPDREEFDQALTDELEAHEIDIICLAGFMRIMSASFVKRWKGKLLNIHPSLLPKFKGMNAQRQALESGDDETGCSVHFVDENVDTGAIILQEIVPIYKTDTEITLQLRLLKSEHIAYAKALRYVATERVKLSDDWQVTWH